MFVWGVSAEAVYSISLQSMSSQYTPRFACKTKKRNSASLIEEASRYKNPIPGTKWRLSYILFYSFY